VRGRRTFARDREIRRHSRASAATEASWMVRCCVSRQGRFGAVSRLRAVRVGASANPSAPIRCELNIWMGDPQLLVGASVRRVSLAQPLAREQVGAGQRPADTGCGRAVRSPLVGGDRTNLDVRSAATCERASTPSDQSVAARCVDHEPLEGSVAEMTFSAWAAASISFNRPPGGEKSSSSGC